VFLRVHDGNSIREGELIPSMGRGRRLQMSCRELQTASARAERGTKGSVGQYAIIEGELCQELELVFSGS
jgi:hypothetical protein